MDESESETGERPTEQAAPIRFGCSVCTDDDPAAALEKVRRLAVERELIDDSDLGVELRACSACEQLYARVASQYRGMMDGDDSYYRDFLPVTHGEARALGSAAEGDVVRMVQTMGSERRRLQQDNERAPEWKEGPMLIWVGG